MEKRNLFVSGKAVVAAVCGAFTAAFGWLGWLVVAWAACMALDWVSGSAAAASRAMPSAPIPSSFAIRIVRFSIYHALPCFFLSAFYHETSPDSTVAGEKMRAAFRLYICARMW